MGSQEILSGRRRQHSGWKKSRSSLSTSCDRISASIVVEEAAQAMGMRLSNITVVTKRRAPAPEQSSVSQLILGILISLCQV
jgi:hypothetical protein